MRNLLFDLDGTLSNPEQGICNSFRHALMKLERVQLDNKQLHRYIGPPLRESFADLLGSKNQAQIEQATNHYREYFASKGLFENELYPGITALLESLHAEGKRIYLATSKPLVYATQIIHYFQLQDYFQGLYGSELSGERSNKAELLRYIIQQEHLDSRDSVMIGDRRHDIVAARVNRMMSIGVLWGFGTKQELREVGTDHLCPSIAELALMLS